MPRKPRATQKKIKTTRCERCGEVVYIPEIAIEGEPVPMTKVKMFYVRPREMNDARVIKITIMASTEKYIEHKEVCSLKGIR